MIRVGDNHTINITMNKYVQESAGNKQIATSDVVQRIITMRGPISTKLVSSPRSDLSII